MYDLAEYRDYTLSPEKLAHSLPEVGCNVEFELRPVLNERKTREAGHTIYDDMEFIIIRPSGTNKLTVEKKWERLTPLERKRYEKAHNAWKAGEDIPVSGTHLKMWPLITPAQMKMLQGCNIFTVEQLAGADANALERIGMGGTKLKNMAEDWLEAAHDSGKIVSEMQALKAEMESMRADLEETKAENEGLRSSITRESSKRGKRKATPSKTVSPPPGPVQSDDVFGPED